MALAFRDEGQEGDRTEIGKDKEAGLREGKRVAACARQQ